MKSYHNFKVVKKVTTSRILSKYNDDKVSKQRFVISAHLFCTCVHWLGPLAVSDTRRLCPEDCEEGPLYLNRSKI